MVQYKVQAGPETVTVALAVGGAALSFEAPTAQVRGVHWMRTPLDVKFTYAGAEVRIWTAGTVVRVRLTETLGSAVAEVYGTVLEFSPLFIDLNFI